MFKLKKNPAALTDVNPRTEQHGDQKKLAVDLAFKIEMANDALDMFDDELRTMLYKKKPAEEVEQDDMLPISELTALRFPNIKKGIPWDWVGQGYRMEINVGITGAQDIYLIDTKLDKFKFELKEGGTVSIAFRLQGYPSATEVGRLSELLQLTCIDLTLEPPSPEKLAQMSLDEERERLRNDPSV